MKYFSAFLLMLISINSFSQDLIEPCKFGQPLIEALQISYTPGNPLGYGPARDILYSEIDNNGLELSGIYTNFTVTLDPNEDPSVSAFQNGAGINAEHVYPQSLGAGNEPAKSDMHNIFPSKVNVNAARGNCPFDEIEDTDTDNWFYLGMQSNSIPLADIEKYSEKDEEDCVFEPREAVKGDIARAMFYFYAIYQSTANAADPNYFSLQKERLYQWHVADPVDVVEKERDSLIALQQGNNNPFIIDSTLAWRAYFEADASYPTGDSNCYGSTTSVLDLVENDWISISSNFVQNELIIYSKKNNGTVLIFDLQGRLVQEFKIEYETRLQVNDLEHGLYILFAHSEDLEKTFKFFKN